MQLKSILKLKTILKLFVLLMLPIFCNAALPPEFQNEKDLKVLVGFIKSHPKVISQLKSIDFKSLSIYFAENCKAEFARKHQSKPKGWVGPAAPLVFIKSNCEIED